jgi:hypothetical protein
VINYRQALRVPVTAGLLCYLRHAALVVDVLADSPPASPSGPARNGGPVKMPATPVPAPTPEAEAGAAPAVAVGAPTSTGSSGAAAQLSRFVRQPASPATPGRAGRSDFPTTVGADPRPVHGPR